MKTKALIIAALLTARLIQAQDFEPIPSCAGSVERLEDRFTGSVALYSSLDLTMGNHFAVVFRAARIKGVPTYIYTLSLIASGYQFDYMDCNSVSMLVDGKKVNLPFTYTPRVDGNGFITETLQAQLTKEQFNKLAYAGKVEYKVCTSEHVIPEKVLCSAREVSRRAVSNSF